MSRRRPVSAAGLAALLAVLLATAPAARAELVEAVVQFCLCRGMEQEVVLPSGARADCVGDTYAVEIDRSENWAEAIGQALHYAAETGRRPKIMLYCAGAERDCLRHRLRLQSTIAHFHLPIAVELHDEASVLERCTLRSD